MYFNKFVPAYHHHFGHQCKVSDYGFTKLIELFEAIPDIVKVSIIFLTKSISILVYNTFFSYCELGTYFWYFFFVIVFTYHRVQIIYYDANIDNFFTEYE